MGATRATSAPWHRPGSKRTPDRGELRWLAQPFQQQLREFRSDALFLVLEVDEYFPTPCGRVPDRLRPSGDVARRIALVAQTEIGVVGGQFERRRGLFAVGDAQRQVARSEPCVD